jgi:DNA transformation protein
MSEGLVELLRELAEPLGGVGFRRMFGGWSLMRDGRMFGLVSDDVLYLKVDAETAERFAERGLERFTYTTRDGRRTVMSYARAPDEVLDDAEVFRDWAEPAIAAALRAAATAGPRRGARAKRRPSPPSSD